MSRNTVLLVEDEPTIRLTIKSYLASRGLKIVDVCDCAAALAAAKEAPPDVAILDYSLPDGNAIELIKQLRAIGFAFPTVVLTAHGSIDLAVRAIKEGAEQFLTKPVELDALFVILERIIENARNRQRQRVRDTNSLKRSPDPFLGNSDVMRQLKEECRRIADADRPVLIHGETGAGKGTLASWLHHNGPRSREAFVDLNCAGLSRELLESELFGHERGAFTGAVAAKEGLLEVAHRGSFFLDEIGDADMAIQPRLLKVLEEKRFRRVGDVRDRIVDVRLIAASHHDLSLAVREGRFRGDLFYRINTLPVRIPPLRERGDDLQLIAEHLLESLCAELRRPMVSLTPEAVRALTAYNWPGNVRELRNVLERAALLSERTLLWPEHLRLGLGIHAPAPPAVETPGASPGASFIPRTLEEAEASHIEEALRHVGGSVVEAARLLGLSRSSLYERLKKYGLQSRSLSAAD